MGIQRPRASAALPLRRADRGPTRSIAVGSSGTFSPGADVEVTKLTAEVIAEPEFSAPIKVARSHLPETVRV